MVMEKIEPVQEYTAMITQEILDRYDGVVRVWDTPRSAIDGGQVVDKISQPTEIVVSEEEKDLYGSLPQRAKVRYGDGKQGWVLYQMIAKMGKEAGANVDLNSVAEWCVDARPRAPDYFIPTRPITPGPPANLSCQSPR